MLEPDKKYLNISEVSERTDVPAYTLRYWEKEFKQAGLTPSDLDLKDLRETLYKQYVSAITKILNNETEKGYSGQRKYSPSDVELIKKIKDLLYNKKYTINGVKKCLTVDRRKKNMSNDIQSNFTDSKFLEEIKQELKAILDILE